MKIGIVTLHKVQNYGSALQAYALLKYINSHQLGQAEIIDYIYPNAFHHTQKKSLYQRIKKLYCVQIRDQFFRRGWLKDIEFEKFYKHFFLLSNQQYKSIDAISKNPPIYDIYVTGSDQVWNVNTLKNDPIMYCSFAPLDAKRISFGASFTNKTLPAQYQDSIRDRLSKYTHIGVREASSINILHSLHLPDNIITQNTCDPTLLLNTSDYDELSKHSKVHIDGDYILIYTLKYAFLPEPALSYVVNKVRQFYNCKVIVIDSHKVKLKQGDKIISGIGPCEFCWLFAHAKYAIVSSFHGTMFSLINRKPFTSIGPARNSEDRRILDIMTSLGLQDNYIPSDETQKNINCSDPYTEEIETNIKDFIRQSKTFLHNAIKQ